MKQILLLFFFLLAVSFAATAQDAVPQKDYEMKTLFGQPVTNGGYGALSVGYTRMDGRNTLLSGIKGGWTMSHKFTLGLAGYGFVNNFSYVNNADEEALTGGFGGLLFEPVFWSRYPVHLTLPLIIGAGGVTYLKDTPAWYDYQPYPSSAFFVIIPGMELELNIVKFFRIAIGVDYRITPDIELKDELGNRLTDPGVMRGFSGHLVLKFGKF